MFSIDSIKGLTVYIASLDVILFTSAKWLSSFNNYASNIVAYAVSVAGVVLTYYTVLHIREKLRGQKLDNEIKAFEVRAKRKEQEERRKKQ